MSGLVMTNPQSKNRESSAARGHILIVDDDQFFVKVLRIILTGENFDVTAACGREEARRLLTEGRFDVIISDLRMPHGDDGLELLQQLRAEGNSVPFIMLTGYGEVDNYMVAMNAGATEYLSKPVMAQDLLAIIQNCLRPGDPAPEAAT